MSKIAYRPQHAMLFLLLFSLTLFSCTKDEPTTVDTDQGIVLDDKEDTDSDETTTEEDTPEATTCTDPSGFIFIENNGLVLVEFENTVFSEDWSLKNDGDGYSGEGYMVWEGDQYFQSPGNGMVSFKIKIENPGTYKFLWYSAVKTGTNGTEHNDSWLRFGDADDFYAQKGGADAKVYPNGSGKSPNPEGASADGWFKIYRSGNNVDFQWQALTYDNDGHEVFVRFDNPGTYLMEVSARSSGHAIDKFALLKDSLPIAAVMSNDEFSSVSCD